MLLKYPIVRLSDTKCYVVSNVYGYNTNVATPLVNDRSAHGMRNCVTARCPLEKSPTCEQLCELITEIQIAHKHFIYARRPPSWPFILSPKGPNTHPYTLVPQRRRRRSRCVGGCVRVFVYVTRHPLYSIFRTHARDASNSHTL